MTIELQIRLSALARSQRRFLGGVSLSSIGSSHLLDVATVPATAAAVSSLVTAGMGVVVGGIWGGSAIYRNQKARSRPRVIPAIDGRLLENLYTSRPDSQVAPGSVVTIALPQKSKQEQRAGSSEALEHIAEIALQAQVDAVIVPAQLAKEALPDVRVSPHPLATLLKQLKDTALAVPSGLEQERFCILTPDQLRQVESGNLTGLFGVLSQRFPNTMPVANVPQTSQAVRDLARQLSTLVRPAVEPHLETEVIFNRDEDGLPGRVRQTPYVLRINSEQDPFQPKVMLQLSHNPEGRPPEPRTLESLTGKSVDIASILAIGSVQNSGQVLPVLAKTFERLQVLHARLQAQEGRQTQDTSMQPEVRYVPRELKIENSLFENPRWIKRFRQSVGVVALSGIFLGGILGIATACAPSSNHTAPPTMSRPAQTISVGEVGTDPTWKTESHGLDASGYYAAVKYYDFVGHRGWSRGEDDAEIEVLPTQLPAGQPFIGMEGYFSPRNGIGVALPVKNQTEVAAAHVTTADGEAVATHITKSRDGTTTLSLDTNPKQMVDVTYELTQAPHSDPATSPIVVEDMAGHALPPNTQDNAADRATSHIMKYYLYDNTHELTRVLNSVTSSEDFIDEFERAQIANCAVAATDVALNQYKGNKTRKLAYTTGFLVKDGQAFLGTGHAWDTDSDGSIIDGTPALKGRTSAEAGLPEVSDAELAAAWNKKKNAYQADKQTPERIPWKQVPVGLVGFAALALAGQRLRYAARGWNEARATRYLSAAQVERVIAHHAYGAPDSVPDLNNVSEVLSAGSLPFSAVIKAAASPGEVAPYLSRKQKQSLRRSARRLLPEYTDT